MFKKFKKVTVLSFFLSFFLVGSFDLLAVTERNHSKELGVTTQNETVITSEVFESGFLNDGSKLPSQFTVVPVIKNQYASRSTSGSYYYSYKKDASRIIKRNAVIGDHPGIKRQKNVKSYYINENTTTKATWSFGYGPISVSYSPIGSNAGFTIKPLTNSGWTQLRIRGDVRETTYTVTKIHKYTGNRVGSHKEKVKSTESIWYDTRRAN